ncbi:UDP-N-acetylmuramoyl-tripeptide--D-alanyl-D-alanine ligase [Garciella nitratireducens]|uniref:UDP-N-acetylmuramoyl-tripeptide--D-alanyl-D-alanine ligase n=1 Tax=Garciella nitratireducens DSM 15102 TaxID=1121911 RepID=A0A1T4JTA4_9FIRM|nr:UDP-N-acetylmuramoyl-tripeptide--D-alanyl-D-alanine ligase [Garciella nitratireducens]SJZ33373.1 UDP-N-acetylmuramoyl-tripeptide--D-alanyl-D-alanine ligase [Garciella nitratireducens DSM 15102]
MQSMTLDEILKAVNGTLLNVIDRKEVHGISIDSRTLKPGDLYIPIIGTRFDGHDFIDQAIGKGAIACFTEKKDYYNKDVNIILVEDTLKALHSLALYYRKKMNIPFIAITGSSGKTTTKDMIASVLEQKYKVLKTKENFNNEIGLPLTLFELESHHEIAVIEIGMSNLGEISRLVHIVYPDIAIITNIGLSHIEKLGSQEKIFQAKKEILETLSKNQIALLNGDDPFLSTIKSDKFKVKFIGIKSNKLDLKAKNIVKTEKGIQFSIKDKNNIIERYFLNLPGLHNIYNSLMAIYIGKYYGMNFKEIQKGLEKFKPSKMRMDIFEKGKVKVINDVYNANPDSMKAALKVLKDSSKIGRKIAVLGDMLEMGKWAAKFHYDVGKFVYNCNVDILIGVGENAKYYVQGAMNEGLCKEKAVLFKTNDEAIAYLDTIIQNDDVILIKGSRGMNMEKIVNFLQERC